MFVGRTCDHHAHRAMLLLPTSLLGLCMPAYRSKAIASVGERKKETTAFQASRMGRVSFDKEPMELELEGKVLEDDKQQGEGERVQCSAWDG
jgi:hypothetical protein